MLARTALSRLLPVAVLAAALAAGADPLYRVGVNNNQSIADPAASGSVDVRFVAAYAGEVTGHNAAAFEASHYIVLSLHAATFRASIPLEPGPYSGTWVSPPHTVPLRTPVRVVIESGINTRMAMSRPDGDGLVSVAAETRFAGPVFRVPEGYSVRTEDGRIVDSRYAAAVLDVPTAVDRASWGRVKERFAAVAGEVTR